MLFSYPQPLEKSIFLKRYKRFFADVELSDGTVETVHCANSGSMKSCLEDRVTAYTLDSKNPKRKLPSSLELLELSDGLACLNTARANQIVESFLKTSIDFPGKNVFLGQDLFTQDFGGFSFFKREAVFSDGTRFDFCLNHKSNAKKAWIEAKSVSLKLDAETLAFPDAVTERGQKHLRELIIANAQGDTAFLFFVFLRGQDLPLKTRVQNFRAAHEIDKKYADLLIEAVASGVQVRLVVPSISPQGFSMLGYFRYEKSQE